VSRPNSILLDSQCSMLNDPASIQRFERGEETATYIWMKCAAAWDDHVAPRGDVEPFDDNGAFLPLYNERNELLLGSCESASAENVLKERERELENAERELADTWFFGGYWRNKVAEAQKRVDEFDLSNDKTPCPIGCYRRSLTQCYPCPNEYSVCGDFGGCHPRGDFASGLLRVRKAHESRPQWFEKRIVDTQGQYTEAVAYLHDQQPDTHVAAVSEAQVVCTCASEFQGRRCTLKVDTLAREDGELSAPVKFRAYAAAIFLCCCCCCTAAGKDVLQALRDNGVKNSGGKKGDKKKREKDVTGGEQDDSNANGSSSAVERTVMIYEAGSLLMQYLQLCAPAFDLSIPWTITCRFCVVYLMKHLVSFNCVALNMLLLSPRALHRAKYHRCSSGVAVDIGLQAVVA
jgi:hypothetical protein